MKKLNYLTKTLIVSTIVICAFFFIHLNYSGKVETHSYDKTPIVEQNGNGQEPTNIDLYSLYYSAKSSENLNMLSADEKNMIKNKIREFEISPLLEKGMNGGLYDVWLYIQICSLFEEEVRSKSLLISYIESLYSPKGFYLSHNKEDTQQTSVNYLLSTKMALESLDLLKHSTLNSEQIYRWLSNDVIQTIDNSQYDPISEGDLLFLIASLEKNLRVEKVHPFNFERNIERVKESLISLEDSFEKLDTIVKLNTLLDEKILIDKVDATNTFKAIQLKDGGFPMYGDINQSADILTTYLILNIRSSLILDFPISENDKTFINDSLISSFY